MLSRTQTFLILAFLLATFPLLYFKMAEIVHERSFLLQQLEDFTDSKTSLAHSRAQYYATIHRIDPIYALAGTDIDDLKLTLDALSESVQESTDIYQGAVDPDLFFPREFLDQLAITEEARKNLLEDTSMAHARMYHAHLVELLAIHKRTLFNFRQLLDELNAPTLVLWNGSTDTKYVAQQLTKALAQIEIIEFKEFRRYACLSDARTCESLENTRATYLHPKPPSASNPVLSRELQKNRDIYESVVDIWHDDISYTIVDTPYDKLPVVSVSESYCAYTQEPRHYRVAWGLSRTHDLPKITANTLDDLFFFKFTEYKDASLLYKVFSEQTSFEYVFQPMSQYLCINYGHDIQEALSALYIHNSLHKNGLFTRVSLETSVEGIQILTELEDRIKNSEVIHTSDINSYMLHLHALYANVGSKGIETILGKEETLRALELLDVWNSRGAWFNTVLAQIHDLMRPELYMFRDESIKVPPAAFLLSRGNFVSMYQLSNPTIVPEYSSFLKIHADAPFGDIYSYRKVLHKLWPTPKAVIDYIYTSSNVLSNLRDAVLRGEF